MKATKPAVHNTALLETSRRWPLKADYLDVPRENAVAFIEKYVASFGFERFRERGNFRQMSFIQPHAFDPLDLHQALEVVIDTVNARCEGNDERVRSLRANMENYFGPLHGFIAVRLCGWPFVIAPKAAFS